MVDTGVKLAEPCQYPEKAALLVSLKPFLATRILEVLGINWQGRLFKLVQTG